MSEIHVGCSGFNYGSWKDNFYPVGLAQKKWFDYYCTVFSTVELNVTFYRLPLLKTFEKWYGETPADFTFSLKGSRYITHVKRLFDSEESLALFFERSFPLKEKLKVVLWQLPPGFAFHIGVLKKFLELLSRYPIRNTIEFRNWGWMTDEVFDLCRTHNVGLCMADWPVFVNRLPLTSDFVYLRRHGLKGNHATCYSRIFLKKEAKGLKKYMEQGKDVYIYFNNDGLGYAPKNAKELQEMIKP